MEELVAERTWKRVARGGSLVSRGEQEEEGGTAYQRTPAPHLEESHASSFTVREWVPARFRPDLISVCLHDSASYK